MVLNVFKAQNCEFVSLQINSSPMEEGWLFKLKLSKEAEETEGLLSEEDYNKFLKAQEDS